MSQAIRKYQTGGKSSQEPELFEWKDVNKYNKSDLVSGLYRNIDTYIQNNGLKGDKADQFRKAAGQFIEGLKSGTVTMNGDGTFTDASGQMSSTGKYDKKFLGLGTKNTENNAFNRVGDYALSYIKGMSPYKAQVEEKPQTKAAPISFKQRLANIAMGGNWDDSLWRKFNSQDRLGFLRQAIQSSHNDFINNPEAEYNKDVFGTRENWIERSSNLLKALEDNKYDPEDLKFSAAMGYGDLGTYLNDEVSKGGSDVNLIDAYRESLIADAKSKGILGDEAINAYVEKGLRDQANKEKEIIDTNKAELKTEATKKYFEDYRKNNQFKSSMSGHFGNVNPNYNIDNLLDYLKGQPNMANYFTNVLGRTSFRPDNGQHIVNNMDAALRVMRSQFPDIGDGFVAVPTTYDFNNYTSIAYNPETKQYKEVSMLDIPALQQIAYAHYENPTDSSKPRVAPRVPKRFQQGGSIGFNREAANAEILKAIKERDAKRQADKEAKVEQAVASGKSPQQATNDSKPHTQWSKADITRMGALMGDVTSLLVSLTGVGSVASAGIGAASTAANQAADMMEGQGFFQSLGNNMGSYALDVLSLIPFAKAAKVPKIIKNVSRFAPLMTTALATYQGLSNGGEYINTWNKIKKGESLTVGDWRNILNSMQVVLGGAAATHRASKGKSHVEAAKSADTVWMKTPQGWRKVNSNIAKQVEAATSIDAQNKLLKDTGIRLEEAKSWGGFGKGKGVAKVETTPYYDFSKPVTTYSGDLPLQHTFGLGEQWIGTFNPISLKIPGVRNAYNKVVHPQAYKRARNAKSAKDDRVTKKANGGVLIPKYQGGKGIRNVQSANDLNWNTDVLGSAGYNDTLGMINPANASTYNNMQRDYSNLGFTATKPGASRLSYNQNVANYQTNFNTNTKVNTGTMASLVKSGRITGRGGSSDKGTQWTADGYAGDQTWLRHLGTNNISADNLAKVRAGVNDNIDVVKNLDTGMLNFMPKAKAAGITSGNPQPAMPTKLESPVPAMGSNPTKKQIRDAKRSQKAAGDGTVRGAAGGEKKGLGGFSVLPEDVIALGRMVGGLATNNKAAEQYKAGLKPLLIDTYENTVPITGNYFAKASADRQASNLTSLAARPRTSDASLQLAGELEAQNKAGDIRFQGDMADADMFYKTRMMAQQESDAAKARRTDVANRNRASMLQIDAAKAQIDSAKTTANYQQVINPYLSGIENQFRQSRAARKQYDAESYRQGLLSTMQPQHDAAVQAGDTAKQQQLLRQYNTDMLNYSRNNVGMPWMFQRTTPSPNTPYTYAKGGRLTAQERIIIQRAKDFNRRMLADNKQFHKDIMAAKKQHADMIKHMSSLTSELIKKGMSWK